MHKPLLLLILLIFAFSCSKKSTLKNTPKKLNSNSLPFKKIALKDMSIFTPTAKNWQIVGNAIANRKKENTFNSTTGVGILLNIPENDSKENLYTNFNHGDIELELDVMMPLQSNAGIYLQSRYGIQLSDSWGVKNPTYNDIGGINERWNNQDKKGYNDGYAPKINVAKAPGLWQHLKIIFHAPKFNEKGHKIKNAWFQEIHLNGVLIHKNVDLKGPTKEGVEKETLLAPIMFQGNKGAVAFKNIKYKLYENKRLGIENTTLTVYDNPKRERSFKNYDKLKILEVLKVDSISPLTRFKGNVQNTLKYTGTFNIPTSGDYLFDINVYGKGLLLINNDTLISTTGIGNDGESVYGKIKLKKGKVNYTLMYNKPFPWGTRFDLYVEGPKIQRYSIPKTSMADINKNKVLKPITIKVTNTPEVQRCFIEHKETKKTHAIAVGLVEKINYAYDLSTASLLQVWSGNFIDVTPMWHSRGKEQTGIPGGFIIASHGNLDFAFLQNENQNWPQKIDENFKQVGYKLKNNKTPLFLFNINGAEISDSFISLSQEKRSLNRIIHIKTEKTIWHKIAEGETIKELSNKTFIINDESYYIDFSNNKTITPIIRSKNGQEELLVKIPTGEQSINYSIIW